MTDLGAELDAELDKAKSRKQLDAERQAKIADLEREGFIVHKPRPPAHETVDLDPRSIRGSNRLRFGIVCCTHFGSKFQAKTSLQEFAAYAKTREVDYLIHAGDVTDGPFNRHNNPAEVFLHDFDRVVEYSAETLPNVAIPWLMIGGNHDSWWELGGGPDVIRALADQRDDITYLGQSLGYITLDDIVIEVVHPHQGSAYAYSYRLQKHIESLTPARKPSVCIMGNFHRYVSLFYRGVLGIQTPAFQRQSSWMANKSLVSEVGGIILEIGGHPKGIAPSMTLEVVYDFEPRDDDWP